LVDDLITEDPKPKGGRPQILKDSELVTILLWGTLKFKEKNLKDIWGIMRDEYAAEFPLFPQYSAFVSHCGGLGAKLFSLLQTLLVSDAPLRFLDSTMVQVCKWVRADFYKVARDGVGKGKNWQGWHMGFKLHGSCNLKRQLCALTLTPANEYDGHQSKNLVNTRTRIAVGDTHYGGKAQTGPIYRKTGCIFFSKPHWKQKKLATPLQNLLLNLRPKIENVWDYMKEHLHLVTSFPRSLNGYLVHYLRVIISYQMIALQG
jgi:hypothetical protein